MRGKVRTWSINPKLLKSKEMPAFLIAPFHAVHLYCGRQSHCGVSAFSEVHKISVQRTSRLLVAIVERPDLILVSCSVTVGSEIKPCSRRLFGHRRSRDQTLFSWVVRSP